MRHLQQAIQTRCRVTFQVKVFKQGRNAGEIPWRILHRNAWWMPFQSEDLPHQKPGAWIKEVQDQVGHKGESNEKSEQKWLTFSVTEFI